MPFRTQQSGRRKIVIITPRPRANRNTDIERATSSQSHRVTDSGPVVRIYYECVRLSIPHFGNNISILDIFDSGCMPGFCVNVIIEYHQFSVRPRSTNDRIIHFDASKHRTKSHRSLLASARALQTHRQFMIFWNCVMCIVHFLVWRQSIRPSVLPKNYFSLHSFLWRRKNVPKPNYYLCALINTHSEPHASD